MSKVLNYDDLAKQHGGTTDYDELARQHGGAEEPSTPLPPLASRQEASKQQFNANQPSLVQGFLGEAKRNAGKLGSVLMNTAPGALTGNESTGHLPLDIALGIMRTGVPTPATMNPLPNAARAGENFQKVMSQAKDIPIDTSEVANVVDRAKQLKATGSSMPKVMSDMARALDRPTLARTPIGTPYIPYSAGRDFATSAGRLSTAESLATNPTMKAQVGQLAAALKDANRGAAVTAGMGDLYDQAIDEYRGAMGIKNAADVAKKWITRAAIGAGTYKLYRELSDK